MNRKFVDEDDALDQTAAGDSLLGGAEKNLQGTSRGLADEVSPSGRPARSEASQGRPRGRTPKPDSATGLATYFLNACPRRSWSTGLEFSNFRAIVAIFSELLRLDVTPGTCRAMVDLYFTQLGGRVPDKAFVWDFKWRRHTLLKRLSETGVSQTPESYSDWNTPATHDQGADDLFTASWTRT
jgi:hypothetical protein